MRLMFQIFTLSFFINSCDYPSLSKDEIIYENDFEGEDLNNIHGGTIIKYLENKMLGNYNNDGFNLHIDEIDGHDYIFISFDLYIHGSWDGNFNGFNLENHGFEDKPDLWIMELRPDMNLYQNQPFHKFETTFSNSPCWPNYCLRQSYPNVYPSENNPKSGADATSLKEICNNSNNSYNTTKYKIEKGFNHKGNALVVRFFDELFQPNAINSDGENVEKCDESWSLDNLTVRAISYD